MKKFIQYIRVSTKKQGDSKLSLEFQQSEIEKYVNGVNGTIISKYTEVETATGKRKRAEIEKALNECLEMNATLVVHKLDRLSRETTFINALLNSGVEFVVTTMPSANRMTIQLLSVIAENEARTISERVRNSIVAKRSRGEIVGNINAIMTKEVRLLGLQVRQNNAKKDLNNIRAIELATLYREKGLSLGQIANKLNESGYKTRRNNSFKDMTVKRLLDRFILDL